ncbi:putative oxidoreductase GLYR1 [Trichonephila inaurata madagascariensis]|uniref:Putative oxidoreductase GLYR1 n=1 Tax=Trichonephila inaurata madagascariensis TaxID=2747483 RepID=A0A8X6XEX7_9ARAC|nr:putative oxidoreductase GLYR1 [Trichonephila inaurata madagascariensis]
MSKDFGVGELVWVKIKKYPFWPGKIVDSEYFAELGFKQSIFKVLHYHVLIFGSNKFSYVPDDEIFLHTKKMLQSCPKIKSAIYQKAVDEIRKESSVLQKGKKKEKKGKGNNIGEESGVKLSEESPSCTKNSQRVNKKLESKVKYETAKRYIPKLPRKVQKQFAVHKLNIDELKRGNIFSFENEPQNKKTSVPESPFVAVEISLKDFSCPLNKPDIKATSKKIGFIGLGVMGQRIVKNLIITGHKVTIWNRSSMKCEIFVKAGAVQACTPADLVEKCDIIFSCLSGSEAVRSVFSGTDGILSGMNKFGNSNKSYVELSTLDIMTSEELGSKFTQRGWRYLDAPVSGSKEEANSGALIIPVSGDVELFRDCETCFAAMAKHVRYVNTEIGSATKMNILTNIHTSTTFATLSEASGLLKKFNFLSPRFMELLNAIPTSLHLESHRALLKNFSSYNGLAYQEKILNLAVSSANLFNEPLFVTRAAHEYIKKAKFLAPDNPDRSRSSSRN